MSGPTFWTETEGCLLAGLLNEIVPAGADGRIPGAGALDVAAFLARKATDDPALTASLRTVLTRAAALAEARGADFEALEAAGRVAVVEALEREAPDAFAALVRYTYMGYYSRADIRPHFGLSARPTQPEGYEVPADDPAEMADLLAPVRARGRCFRPS